MEDKQEKELVRTMSNKILGGVIGGIGEYYDWKHGTTILVRLLYFILIVSTSFIPSPWGNICTLLVFSYLLLLFVLKTDDGSKQFPVYFGVSITIVIAFLCVLLSGSLPNWIPFDVYTYFIPSILLLGTVLDLIDEFIKTKKKKKSNDEK